MKIQVLDIRGCALFPFYGPEKRNAKVDVMETLRSSIA